MIDLVTKSSHEARTRSSKRILPSHLKQATMANEQFDFLGEIVARVPDAPPPGSGASRNGDGGGGGLDGDEDGVGEDSGAAMGVTSGGRRKRPGRKRKVDMAGGGGDD